MPSLFIATTFGNRNSKGFGCFSLADQSFDMVKSILNSSSLFTGIYERREPGDLKNKFKSIAEHYGKLKRGKSEIETNDGRLIQPYQKSLLWDYMCNNQPADWEKKKIKMFLKENHRNVFTQLKYNRNKGQHRIETCLPTDQENYQYIRSIMGLAEHFEFVKQNGSKLKVNISDSLSHNEATKHLAVERFKSPLQYYIFGDTIFLLTQKIPNEFIYYNTENNEQKIRHFRFTFPDLQRPNYFDILVPEIFDLFNFIQQQTDFRKI